MSGRRRVTAKLKARTTKSGARRSKVATPVTRIAKLERALKGAKSKLASREASLEQNIDALRNAEIRHAALIESAADAVISIDANGLVTGWNPRAVSMFGWTQSEARGRKLSDLIIPAPMRAKHDAGMARYLKDRRANILNRTIQVRGCRRDGSEFPTELSIWPVDTREGLEFGAFLRDVSHREAVLEAMKRSEERYRSVIENVAEGIIVVQDGRIVYANPRTAHITGRSVEELMSLPFTTSIHPEDVAMVVERYRARLRGDTDLSHYGFRIYTKQGEIRFVELSAVLMEWENRPATLSFLVDDTERKLLQDKLKNNLAEREVILNSTQIGITFVVDRKLQWINAKFADMLGYKTDELIGRSTEMLYPTDDDFRRLTVPAGIELRAGRGFTAETPMRCKDGSQILLQTYANSIDKNDISRGVIWTCIDITEQRKAEENTRIALQKQTELNELKSRFISMASHEFRTPLATIRSSVELLQHYEDKLTPDKRATMLDSIESAVQRMTVMLENVLLIGRTEAGSMVFKPAPLRFTTFCRQVADELRSAMRGELDKIEFHLRLPSGEDVRLLDEALLRHIVVNLLTNAFKYSPGGGKVHFAAEANDNNVTFTVADQGIGIPEKDRAKIFDSFNRASNVGGIAGTGLGLSIVKEAVQCHGGQIQLESKVGGGTTFTVTVPAPIAEGA